MYKRIRDLREDRDLTQTQIAKILGMSQTGYSKYETGENDLPTSILIKLSDYYGVSIDYILGMTDEPKRYPAIKDFNDIINRQNS
ncbi:MAG: helix-turn-helix transcriptional regulator [Clostridiaceae bacterium]|nr:helix-turn-helix transcriptional regulator [Clostridiaceae bacterium]